MPDNFFAILNDGAVRRIRLAPAIEPDIRASFVDYGEPWLSEREEVKFDGSYKVDDDEVLYVEMPLPDEIASMATNSIGIPILDLQTEYIKALVWYENNKYYFQNFDNRKLLRNRNVIVYTNQTYNRLQEDAFVVDNGVHAVYASGKFYFLSYANANKIFGLSEFYREATDAEVITFEKNKLLAIEDKGWFLENANSVMRKQIAAIQANDVLRNADTKKIKRDAKKCNLKIGLDGNSKIIFPTDKKVCKEILVFLNEGYYLGMITGTPFRANSKRPVS